MATTSSQSSYDLLNVSGPLTIETILRTLQQRFNDGHCYVSLLYSKINTCHVLFCVDMDGSSATVRESFRAS